MKKLTGVVIILLALAIGIIPIFTDCLANGRSLTTADGKSVPMKCHWTALAEIGLAIPLVLTGILNITSKRKETLRSLSLVNLAMGTLVILFPTLLIGVCGMASMPCNLVEKPLLIMSGILIMGASLVTLFSSRNMIEPVAA